MKELLKKLKNPPGEYRPIPFWSWNDRLDPEFLKWQIREMHKAGIGGYFMHARGGLETGYLGEDWMKCIKACIDEGNKLGMYSWCYDENGCPSGSAGGAVTALGEKFHIKWLEMEVLKQDEAINMDDKVLGIYQIDYITSRIDCFVRPEDAGLMNGENGKIIIVKRRSDSWYIDVLDEDAVKAFIESTYDKYYKSFKAEFGKGIPGFFTDEPQYSREKIPWSDILPERFREKYGYDLTGMLPALFMECEGYEKVRYDFWSLVNELYAESFGAQIYRWCEDHNCRLAGHVMFEDNLFFQMSATAGCMPFYEYMHVPGIDWLCRRVGSPVTPKQASSVANQLGKKFVLSEMFALCGWDVSFEELKWIAEWQYVNGINLMCQHLQSYTLRGMRKRDFPPSLFYHQSWWEEYRLFNDYFARLGILLASGKHVADVLLLHPIRSCWIAYDLSNNETMKKLNNDFLRITEALSGLHIDYHYGDEGIIRKYGEVSGNRFIVGKSEYKVVILPSMLTMDEYTARLLIKFANNGGTVISTGDFPVYISGMPGRKSMQLNDRVMHIGNNKEMLYDLLVQMSIPAISIAEDNAEIEEIHYQQRDLGDMQIFFMVNHDRTKAFDAVVKMKGIGGVRRIAVENAKLDKIDYTQDDRNRNTKVNLRFLPMQSHVIIFDREDKNEGIADVGASKEIEVKLGEDWDIEEMDLNSLTLDYCSYNLNDGEWVGPVPVISLREKLLKLKEDYEVSIKYRFEVGMKPEEIAQIDEEFFLVLETPGEYGIYINEKHIGYQDQGWWKDSEFKKINIKQYVKAGFNEVILKRRFCQSEEQASRTERRELANNAELESIYIVGNFGVISKSEYTYGERRSVFSDGPFAIIHKPVKVRRGDLTQQGFCFFAGSIKLSQTIRIQKRDSERLILDMGNPDAIISKVYINGSLVKVLPWAPYYMDISDFVLEGENKISIQLFAGNRNLLGPHHHAGGELYTVEPASFTDKMGWTDWEFGKEFGLNFGLDRWRDKYCFVKFGLEY